MKKIIALLLLVLAGGIYFYQTNKTRSSPNLITQNVKVESGEYVTLAQIDGYKSPEESDRSGFIVPGKYFLTKEQKGNWLSIKTTQEQFSWEGWIKVSGDAYKLVKEE